MRTNIVIDEELMNEAMKATGYKTKRETVEHALKLVVMQKRQSEIRNLFGKFDWQGDLDKERRDIDDDDLDFGPPDRR